MARLLSDFHLYANVSTSVNQAVDKLNDALVERSHQGMFVTFVGTILNADTGEFVFVNAGHLPLLRIRNKGKQVEKIARASNIPLGIKKSIEYQKSSIQLEHGDYIIFFTDGIIEARDTQKREMSLERFIRFLHKKWQSPEQLITQAKKEIDKFTESAEQHDDITLVALKWC